MFLTPLLISSDSTINHENFRLMFYFDVVFMIDRFLDLFGSFYKPNGLMEHRLHAVVLIPTEISFFKGVFTHFELQFVKKTTFLINNLSFKLFLEIFISLAPLFIYTSRGEIKCYWFGLFKVARYARLFEMDEHIQRYIEGHTENKTVFEMKQME